MFVSRQKVVHGQDLTRSPFKMTDTRVRGNVSLVASNTHTITAHTSEVTSIAFSHSVLATCSADKTVRLWDVKDFSELPNSPLLGHTYQIHCCSFSPLGSVLATCSTDGTVRLWILKTGELAAVLTHPSKCAVRVCQFSTDGTMLITGGDDDQACLWNVATKKLIKTLQGHEESITAAAISPDGNYAVTGCSGGDFGGELLVWDAQFGHGRFLKRVTECHDLGVSCCQFSPTFGVTDKASGPSTFNTFLLATGGKDNMVKLWLFDCEVGSVNVNIRLDTMLPGHTDSVLWLSFSPNGAMIASGSIDKTARLWSAESKQALVSLDNHTSYVSSCAFSVEGCTLATSSNDNTVKIWKLSNTANIMEGLTGYEDSQDTTSSAGADAFSQVAIVKWSVEDVCQWITSLGLEQYEEQFRTNAIDGRELLALSAGDLESSLGMAALGHRNKLLRAREGVQQHPISGKVAEPSNTPEEFLCPIAQEIMKDPVIASDGYTYDRPVILAWMARGEQRSPMTNMPLTTSELTPNRTLKMMIQKFLQNH